MSRVFSSFSKLHMLPDMVLSLLLSLLSLSKIRWDEAPWLEMFVEAKRGRILVNGCVVCCILFYTVSRKRCRLALHGFVCFFFFFFSKWPCLATCFSLLVFLSKWPEATCMTCLLFFALLVELEMVVTPPDSCILLCLLPRLINIFENARWVR
jgi:hypothetical protein